MSKTPEMLSPGTAFDRIAAEYDHQFSRLASTTRLRRAVMTEVTRHVKSPASILDLGCGTGEDACHLAQNGFDVLASDASAQMIAEAGKKFAGLSGLELLHCGIERVPSVLDRKTRFDAVLSNFGAVNCLSSLEPLQEISRIYLKPGGYLFLCLINRYCLRELARIEFRRLKASGSPVRLKDDQTVRCYYYGTGKLKWPGHELKGVHGLGVLGKSDVWSFWPFNRLGDHYFAVLQKKT